MTNLLFENVEDLSLVAVRESEQSVSYLQLREKIAKRAAGIRKHLGVDAKIAVYLPRSINQMVSMLAIFEAGLTYVPIDVDVAQERVEYIINKADCESIITTQELYNSLDENIKQTTSFLDTVLIDSEGVLENEENNKINNDTDAYIIFTSGTTGNPKGVRISYANLTNLIKSSYKYFQSGRKHETILLNSLSFDFSIWEILIALSSGDSINILDDYVRLDQKKLIEVISEKKIDSLAITPSYMSALINVMDMYKIDIKNIISRIILGAEKVGTRLISDIFEHCGPEVEIYNAYGPTEVTVCSFIKKIRADEMDRYNRLKSVPIGSPFQDVKAMVIKMNDNEAETKGELILYGEAVSDRGYIGASEEENKKFGEIDGERAYHTGDIVSIDNDEYVFIERNDSQCKINGFRVELDEIRNLILSYPMVSDAYVTTYSVSDFTTVIIAFVVGKSGYSEKDLREICESKLNKYMRPNYYVKAKEFPRTNNGKLDVARLIETFKYNIVSVDSAAEINYGRTLVVTLGKEVEIGMMYGQQYNAEDIDLFLKNIRKILIEEIQPLLGDQAMNVLAIVRSVWKEVLNNEQILDTDNFFELGGDSISSLRASLKLRDYGIFVPADSLFHYQSITELVNYIKSIGINQGKIREE